MNHKIEEILEFKEIIQQVADYTLTFQGRKAVNQLHPTNNRAQIKKDFTEIEEATAIVREQSQIPIAELPNLSEHFKRIEIGADLNGVELAQIGRVLRIVNTLAQFFEQMAIETPIISLKELADKLITLPKIRQALAVIDESGYVRDEASDYLANLRHSVKRIERQIRERLERYTKESAEYLSEPIITIRNERFVLPVKHEYRNKFGGVIHDQSASGQTLYIEPTKTLTLNNDLSSAKSAEKAEIQRILRELTADLKPYLNELKQNTWVIGRLDVVQAKVSFAAKIKGIIPNISEQQEIELIDARHPLISTELVVANTIELGKAYRSMVITGPNTGGKTITLKTLGLLQLMAQAGLPISARETSTVAILDDIFADIGDEQSISQNLSTFSSHMTHTVSILKQTSQNTLTLFDELGAGTDPQEGAALAIAILEFIRSQNGLVVATTHYPELKIYGVNTPNTINASMAFDVETLSPTYQLLIGIPGKSNAFEISRRLGLNDRIINHAKSLAGSESHEINEMLEKLEQTNSQLTQSLAAAEQIEAENELLHADLEAMYQKFTREKDAMLKKADERAQAIVAKTETDAAVIMAALREKNSAKEHELIEAKTQIKNLRDTGVDLSNNKVLKRAKAQKALKIGDEVLVLNYGQRATVIRLLADDSYEVQMGLIKMKAKRSELEKVAKEVEKQSKATVKRAKRAISGAQSIKTELDLRGMRYEAAMTELDRYIDSALLQNYPHVRIIHGKGTGALQQGVWQYLRANRQVKHFEFATPNSGGNGVTIVEFK
ncbi:MULTISPECIES: endonuclease MutS2 [unclassified Enterococcus]|uniref:endonuclease MutS2 n=1 Tax=unclassified Enterococcus TaxID=2608891 RepID=UPI00155713CA|nr:MULTISPECIES: endonuclease MutS2 [unclassified Enterococcus]MBS7577643.1 endonuclease MutS2 [Enterococcus sp. MMGLQ5-2]MBS7584163.1 endonuclease MutS2 [Enterococcus sp. MMGLQ5-1]NPD12021.1 endonuclease MutS2 [Enterococcus sp. MMGLQ5-1]NPD37476.1 endonuclease MutS2 [Enterococcus sp. MMGLQ5-2]